MPMSTVVMGTAGSNTSGIVVFVLLPGDGDRIMGSDGEGDRCEGDGLIDVFVAVELPQQEATTLSRITQTNRNVSRPLCTVKEEFREKSRK
jgi:hypothetical protein